MFSIGKYFSKGAPAYTNDKKGLTLVEVLAALLLLSWLALSIPLIFGPVAGWITKARMETTAVNYAASMLEQLRTEPEKLSPLNSGKTAGELGIAYESPCAGMTGQISSIESQQSLPDVYEVIARVDWFQAGQLQTLQLVTLIRKEPR